MGGTGEPLSTFTVPEGEGTIKGGMGDSGDEDPGGGAPKPGEVKKGEFDGICPEDAPDDPDCDDDDDDLDLDDDEDLDADDEKGAGEEGADDSKK